MTIKEFLAEYDNELRPLRNLVQKTEGTDLNWRPRVDMMSTGQVIYHITEGIAEGLRCLLTGNWPFTAETMLPTVDQIKSVVSVKEGLAALEKDRTETEQVLQELSDQEFASKYVETPWGYNGNMWRISLFFLEHMKMHKMQLFLYLRIQGLPISTMDLY
ncbi:MAG: DinB family protein [bacterium]